MTPQLNSCGVFYLIQILKFVAHVLRMKYIYTGTNHAAFDRIDIPSGDPRFNFMIPQAELDANPEVSNP